MQQLVVNDFKMDDYLELLLEIHTQAHTTPYLLRHFTRRYVSHHSGEQLLFSAQEGKVWDHIYFKEIDELHFSASSTTKFDLSPLYL